MKRWAFLALFVFFPLTVQAGEPDCSGTDSWPAAMAGVKLKNAGFVEQIDFIQVEVERLASEEMMVDVYPELYRQVHKIRLTHRNGQMFNVITVNLASEQECSMSEPDVYLLDSETPLLVKKNN